MKMHNKIFEQLTQVCRDENIQLFMHKNTKSLTTHLYSKEQYLEDKRNGESLCGTYVHVIKRFTSLIDPTFKPQIHLKSKIDIWTFAHELGHHFTFIKHDAHSLRRREKEREADEYAKALIKYFIPKRRHRVVISLQALFGFSRILHSKNSKKYNPAEDLRVPQMTPNI